MQICSRLIMGFSLLSTFLIQDIFPITEESIEQEYTIAGNYLMLTSEHTAREIERKARRSMIPFSS